MHTLAHRNACKIGNSHHFFAHFILVSVFLIILSHSDRLSKLILSLSDRLIRTNFSQSDQAIKLSLLHSDRAIQLILAHSDRAIQLILSHSDQAIQLILSHSDRTIKLILLHSDRAIQLIFRRVRTIWRSCGTCPGRRDRTWRRRAADSPADGSQIACPRSSRRSRKPWSSFG